MNRLLARPTRHLLLLACMGAVAGLPVVLPGQAVRSGSAAPTGSRLPAPHGAWNVVPSPNTGTPHNYFSGVASIAANDVLAVGAHGSAPDQAAQRIQHWDGLQWT